jgi:hypothetical protein
MDEEIIDIIATHSPFSPEDVKNAYDVFKSYDLILRAIPLCQELGIVNLQVGCRLCKD